MRLLGTYLWKEWRDHRAVLVGMVLAVPPLLAVMGLSLPRRAFDHQGFAGFAALACLALFVVSLATDLVPGEARRGHRWFLERLPGGLGAAFRGKLTLFVAGAIAFAAYGYLGGAVTGRLVAGQWPSAPSFGEATWTVAVVALWAFAVSCVPPRGALSLPAVGALALLLALPAVLLWMLYPWPAEYVMTASDGPEAWWRWESAALWAIGGVGAAWAAFRQRSFPRACRACLAIAVVCALPYWAHAGYGVYRWHADAVPTLGSGFLGEGGRYVFLNRALEDGRRAIVLPPVILDLETGVAREVEESWALFVCAERPWHAHAGTPQRYVRLDDYGPAARGVIGFLDARTAEPAAPTEEDLRAALRLASPWRLGDGRHAWLRDDCLEADAPGSGFELLAKRGWWSPSGTGLVHSSNLTYYDLSRGRQYTRKDLELRATHVWIRPGRWLIRTKGAYELFDPDSGSSSPAVGLEPADVVRVFLDDGRVFVRRDGGPALLDPETGGTTALSLPAELAGATVVEAARAFDRPARTPDGRRVLLLYGPHGGGDRDVYWCAFARLDPGDRLAPTAVLRGFVTLLGCPNDDEAIVVVNNTGVVRLGFGSDEQQEIWRVR